MRRLALLLALALALAAAPARAEPAEGDMCLGKGGEAAADGDLTLGRCKRSTGGGPEEGLFATSCYTGNGTDDRIVVTGIPLAKAGFIKVCEVTPDAGNSNSCVYWIPGLTAGFSCAVGNVDFLDGVGFNACGLGNTTGFIKSVIEEGFRLGTSAAAPINATGRPYCMWAWSKTDNFHGTGTYVGDGTASRTIDLGVTPDVAIAWGRLTSSSNENQGLMRTSNMPVDTSFSIQHSLSLGAVTDGVKAFTSGATKGITVGITRNATGVTYHYAWWKSGPKQGVVGWTGNGASLDAGKCAAATDTQQIAAPCTPVRNVWGTSATAPSPCTFTGRPCRYDRPVSVGLAIAGPGHTTSDAYGFLVDQPNNSVGETFSALDSPVQTFTVGGAPNLGGGSCNDLNAAYYGWVTCATAPTIGTVAPVNWSVGFVAEWNFDFSTPAAEVTGSTAVSAPNNPLSSSGTIACLTRQCDLDDVNSVARSSATVLVGDQSAIFAPASTQRLACTLSVDCDELDLGGAGGNLTFGCFARATTDITSDFMTKGVVSGAKHYGLGRSLTNDTLVVTARDSVGLKTASSANNAFPINTWNFVAGVVNNTGDTISTSVDGVAGSGTAFALDVTTGTGTNFEIGRDVAAAGAYYEGALDACFVDDAAWSATSLCRAASCGPTGQLCTCFLGDPTVYVSFGRNHTDCGSCALPACNVATP